MKNKYIIAGIALLFAGCATDSTPESSMIRINNSTGLYIDSLIVGNQHYIKLDTGANTEYREFQVAYGYNYVRLYSPDTILEIQPIDYVGEKPLGKGRFTYVLTIDSASGYEYFNIRSKKDD